MGEKVMFGPLLVVVFGHSVEKLAVLEDKVVHMLDVAGLQLVLHHCGE